MIGIVLNWTPTDIVNAITLPSHDKHYDINYSFYRDAFVLGYVTSPKANVLLMNKVPPQKVRSVKKPKKEPTRMPTQTLILDGGANIHIINNPNFLSCNVSCIGKWINTTGSCTPCKKFDRLCEELKSLPLPDYGYLYQLNDIGNIISLFLLSDLHRITMDTDVENDVYIHDRHEES